MKRKRKTRSRRLGELTNPPEPELRLRVCDGVGMRRFCVSRLHICEVVLLGTRVSFVLVLVVHAY
eukprot:scaffold91074_cov32-Tisochrysis_lutea.AAC.1